MEQGSALEFSPESIQSSPKRETGSAVGRAGGLAPAQPEWLAPVRQQAVRRDGSGSEPFELARLWRALCGGTLRPIDVFYADDRSYAVFAEREPTAAARRAVGGRRLQILTRVLLGQSPKSVAMDLRIAPSTVATSIGDCLRAMGLNCRASSLPLLLLMAARAANGSSMPVAARMSRIEGPEGNAVVISIPRLDSQLPSSLSVAEIRVLHSLLRGETHAQIALARGTSPRTVANQIGAAFHKLGVSGRRELIELLLSRASNRSASDHAAE